MMLRNCPRQKEVKDLLERGQWPQASAAELRTHVSGCRGCGEFVRVTMAFQQARTEASAEARLGSPGVLWWRAQLRRRNEAVERIGRPILGAQIFALAVNLLLAAVFVVWQARHGVEWLTWLEELPQTAVGHLDTLWGYALSGSSWTVLAMVAAAATVALVGGVVVFFASEKS